ncbi:MAG: diaminopimelate epimerase [Clostridia bacterium]|nr:diaminopimelate epimerase [Clostridia bacterium]
MNGLGNDYIYIDERYEKINDPHDIAVRLSDRRFGVGGDGIVLLNESKIADISMRIFNSDGTEAEICGNALRCVGKYAIEHHLATGNKVSIETLIGVREVTVTKKNGVVTQASVAIENIMSGLHDYPFCREIEVHNKVIVGYCVDVGNPHFVTFVQDFSEEMILLGNKISRRDTFFTEGINVEFVKYREREKELIVRVVERGSGETFSCGTGAAAVTFVAHKLGLIDEKVDIKLRGGTFTCSFRNENTIVVDGDVKENFVGMIKME